MIILKETVKKELTFTWILINSMYQEYHAKYYIPLKILHLRDNVMVFRTFSHNTISACVSTVLKHNTKYYSTLIVFNAALNSKHSKSSSNGGKSWHLTTNHSFLIL